MMPGVDESLRGSLLFKRLSPEDRARLAEHARVRSYAKGEAIFSEGDPSDFFFDITTGRVKIFKMTPTGKDVILEIFGAGDPLGAVAAYMGRPFPASAVCGVCPPTRSVTATAVPLLASVRKVCTGRQVPAAQPPVRVEATVRFATRTMYVPALRVNE